MLIGIEKWYCTLFYTARKNFLIEQKASSGDKKSYYGKYGRHKSSRGEEEGERKICNLESDHCFVEYSVCHHANLPTAVLFT